MELCAGSLKNCKDIRCFPALLLAYIDCEVGCQIRVASLFMES